jgi:glycosyltransferase involved in cell wall biosynthesis
VDAIESGVTDLVVDPRDVRGLREALTQLHADVELRRWLGAGGRARVGECFALEAAGRLLAKTYQLESGS